VRPDAQRREFEDLEQGTVAHGIDVDALLKDLNAAAKEDEVKSSLNSLPAQFLGVVSRRWRRVRLGLV